MSEIGEGLSTLGQSLRASEISKIAFTNCGDQGRDAFAISIIKNVIDGKQFSASRAAVVRRYSRRRGCRFGTFVPIKDTTNMAMDISVLPCVAYEDSGIGIVHMEFAELGLLL